MWLVCKSPLGHLGVQVGRDTLVSGGSAEVSVSTSTDARSDGAYWHAAPAKVLVDERKSQDLLAGGYMVVRLPENDLPLLAIGHPGTERGTGVLHGGRVDAPVTVVALAFRRRQARWPISPGRQARLL